MTENENYRMFKIQNLKNTERSKYRKLKVQNDQNTEFEKQKITLKT
jgi:hypothetical protein